MQISGKLLSAMGFEEREDGTWKFWNNYTAPEEQHCAGELTIIMIPPQTKKGKPSKKKGREWTYCHEEDRSQGSCDLEKFMLWFLHDIATAGERAAQARIRNALGLLE